MAGELTFLFTDVVGSTRRWETDATSMGAALADHDAAIAAAVAGAGGTLLKTKGEGDSTVSVFDAPADALRAAAAAQRALALPVRMAIHVGPAETRDGDYFGPTLNRAARLRAIAHGGQVICSQAAARGAESALTGGLSLHEIGVHRLKDLTSPEQVYQLVGDGLAQEFPPLLSLNRTTTNLPAQTSSFVGRETAMRELRGLLDDSRLVTLTGPGGSGKTRLAMQVAADASDAFPDGVWLAELASIIEGQNIAHVVASAMGAQLMPGDANTQVGAALADKHALVVLDNCEHLVDDAAACATAILEAAPHVRVLATSRERLRIAGEATWSVPPLDVTTDAVALFCDRAAAASGFVLDDGNADAVHAVCRRVEGVPLALELAAARVRVMPVTELATRLQRHWDILSGGDRTAAPHQRSLRATIDWSHSLLSPHAQRVLHRLAVFRGGFELASAEQIVTDEEISEYDALDVIQDLLDKSLIALDYDAGRYKMLETVREYALDHLAADGLLDATQRRHALHFVAQLQVVEDRILWGKNQFEALQFASREHDNITAAMTWGLEHDHEIAGQLMAHVFASWYALGQPEMASWYERLVPYFDELSDETAARAGLAVGSILGYLGQQEVAYALLDRAIAAARAVGDIDILAIALCLSASVRRVYDELDDALPLAREALGLRAVVEGPLIRALVCSWCSWVLFDTGSHDEAREVIVEAHKLCLEMDDHVLRSSVLDSIGQYAPDYMTIEQAFVELEDERRWLRAAGASDAASGLANIGWSLLRDGAWDDALARIDGLLALPQQHWRQTFAWKMIRAGLLQLIGDPAEGAALMEELFAEVRTSVDRHHLLCELAISRRNVGDLAGAEAAADEALRYLLDGHNPEGGWGAGPTRPLVGMLLRVIATHRVLRGADDATLARILGVADVLLGEWEYDALFELTRINRGFEGRLPKPDPAAAAFAREASLTDAAAFALDEKS